MGGNRGRDVRSGRRPGSLVAMAVTLVVVGVLLPLVIPVARASASGDDTSPMPRAATASVGATAASAGVSASGQAAATVPFEVPPGIAGLVPRVALSASAVKPTSGGSIVGTGWVLTGFSSIERCPLSRGAAGDWARPFEDPFGRPDAFCLDGTPLVAVRGDYGADGTEYRTEVDSFARITSHGGDADRGPDGFEVEMPDARIVRFGYDDDAVQAVGDRRRTWLESEERDRSGNTMTYAYDRACVLTACTQLAPSEIRYGGHHGGGVDQDPDRSIRFGYDGRPDWWSRYTRGLTDFEFRRLADVETYVGDQLVRRYHLDYETRNDYSRLRSLVECTRPEADAQPCKPPTTFSYAPGSGPAGDVGPGPTVSPYFGNGPAARAAGPTIVLDVNGDGRDDLFYASPSSAASCQIDLTVCVGTWTYRLAVATGDRSNPYAVEDTHIRSNPGADVTVPCFSQDSVFDFDGDGRDDLLDNCDPTKVLLSAGFGRSVEESRVDALHDDELTPKAAWLADLDGDGLTDLVTCVDTGGHGNPADHRLALYLNQGPGVPFDAAHRRLVDDVGNQGTYPDASGIVGPPEPCEAPLLVDTDGDGVVNVMKREWALAGRPDSHTTRWTQTWKTLSLTPDDARWDDSGLVFDETFDSDADPLREFYNSHSPTYTRGQGIALATWARKWQMRVLDANGDGLQDILRYDGNADDPVHLAINTGHGFTSDTNNGLLAGVPGSTRPKMTPYEFARLQVVDDDNDGRDDVTFPIGDPAQPDALRWVVGSAQAQGPFELRDLTGDHWHLGSHAMPVEADVDGDGSPDLLVAEEGGSDGLGNPTAAVQIHYGSQARANLLSTMTDGSGRGINWDYDTRDAAGAPTYTRSEACVSRDHVTCVGHVGPLVSSMTVLAARHTGSDVDDVDRISRQAYHWADARQAWFGRGALGFGSRTVATFGATDGQQRGTTTTTFDPGTYRESVDGSPVHHWYPRAGHVVEEHTVSGAVVQGGAEVAEHRDTTTEDAEAVSSGGMPYSYPGSATVRVSMVDLDSGATHVAGEVATGHTVDADGNVGIQWHEVRDAGGTAVARTASGTDYENGDDRRAQWLLGLPRHQVVVGWRQGAAQQDQVTDFTHTPDRGLLDTVTRAPDGDPHTRRVDTYGYDAWGNVTSDETSAAGYESRRTAIGYDDRGLSPITVTDALDRVTHVTFDGEVGGLAVAVDPNAVVTRQSYDGFGRPVRHHGPTGDSVVTYSVADDAGGSAARTRTVTRTDGGPTVTAYADALGRTVRQVVTGYGGADVSTETTYDDGNHPLTVSRPHLAGDDSQGVVTTAYDSLGRPVSTTRPDEDGVGGRAMTTMSYDWPGAVPGHDAWTDGVRGSAVSAVATDDPTGRRRWAVADGTGALVATVDPTGGTTQLEYSAFGVLTRLADGAGTTSYDVDPYGRTTRVTSPDVGIRVATWTPFDQLEREQQGEGPYSDDARQYTEYYSDYLYDRLGRMTDRHDTVADGTENGRTHWGYDEDGPNTAGKLTSTSVRNYRGELASVKTFHYEPVPDSGPNRGLLAAVDEVDDSITSCYRPDGSVPVAYAVDTRTAPRFTTTYGYDGTGHLTHIEYPAMAGRPLGVDQHYDERGSLTGVTDSRSGAPFWHLDSADQGYRIGRETLGNGVTTTYRYQPGSGRLDQLRSQRSDGGVAQELTYGYDADGTTRSLVDGVDASRSRAFEHDPAGRLARVRLLDGNDPASPGATVEGYDYDAAGRLAHQDGVGDYRYDHGGHFATAAGTTTYDQDENTGNQWLATPNGDHTHSDLSSTTQRGQLDRYIHANQTADENTVDITYDAYGRRVRRNDWRGAIVDYSTDLVSRSEWRDPARDIDHRALVRVAGRPVAEVQRAEHRSDGTSAERVEYPMPDVVGSPRRWTDAGGNADRSTAFTAFGRSDPAAGESDLVGFGGHQPDPMVGGVDAGARHLDPVKAQFTVPDAASVDLTAGPTAPQADLLGRVAASVAPPDGRTPPAAASSLTDPYAYGAGDPLGYVDPDGREPTGALEAIGEFGAGVIAGFAPTLVPLGVNLPWWHPMGAWNPQTPPWFTLGAGVGQIAGGSLQLVEGTAMFAAADAAAAGTLVAPIAAPLSVPAAGALGAGGFAQFASGYANWVLGALSVFRGTVDVLREYGRAAPAPAPAPDSANGGPVAVEGRTTSPVAPALIGGGPAAAAMVGGSPAAVGRSDRPRVSQFFAGRYLWKPEIDYLQRLFGAITDAIQQGVNNAVSEGIRSATWSANNGVIAGAGGSGIPGVPGPGSPGGPVDGPTPSGYIVITF